MPASFTLSLFTFYYYPTKKKNTIFYLYRKQKVKFKTNKTLNKSKNPDFVFTSHTFWATKQVTKRKNMKKNIMGQRGIPSLVRSIERTRPTGPAPTIRTGSTVSLPLKNLESDKPLLRNGLNPSGFALNLILAIPWCFWRPLKLLLINPKTLIMTQ